MGDFLAFKDTLQNYDNDDDDDDEGERLSIYCIILLVVKGTKGGIGYTYRAKAGVGWGVGVFSCIKSLKPMLMVSENDRRWLLFLSF
jgi:hypothetical protein